MEKNMKSILIANRGEVSIRIAQAAAELGLNSVAVYSEDDAGALHPRRADSAVALEGKGPRAYLDGAALIAAAKRAGADAIHPGYGFLSESADFARAVGEAGLLFIGPSPEALDLLGDKTRARKLAREVGAPVNPGLDAASSPEEIAAFMATLKGAPIVLKAVSGGGGRGMRIVNRPEDLAEAFAAASAEAKAAFGNGDLYAERFLARARHVEVQILGDGKDVVHLWERDCTLQRRHQKLVEIAPAPALDGAIRQRLLDASVAMARAVSYRGLGTFEFLVGADGALAFIEANPRLQVEHTVTEAITGVDLAQAQIRTVAGESLAALGLTQDRIPAPSGAAVQLRINLERMDREGGAIPAGGVIAAYEPPGGPGLRTDGAGFAGLRPSPAFDSLLAKLIAHAPEGLEAALTRARRALRAFRIEGVETNIPYLQALLDLPELAAGTAPTRLIEERAGEIHDASKTPPAPLLPAMAEAAAPRGRRTVDAADPLAVLSFGAGGDAPSAQASDEKGAVAAPMQGTILSLEAEPGAAIRKGQTLFVMEAMKMQHSIKAPSAGVLTRFAVAPGDTVYEGDPLAVIEETDSAEDGPDTATEVDLDRIRPDLQELIDRRALTLDENRPEAVARRRAKGKRMARENIARLCAPDSFIEYGDLAIAAQRSRRSVEDLMKNTPADGLITGVGKVNEDLFGPDASRVGVLHYDYTVLAGTQGKMNHTKTDRMLHVIETQRMPMVFFCEGGGGRPGDVDAALTSVAGLWVTTFNQHARLSGLAPMVGVASGRLFAGNAALLGCCDVVIATRDSCIGMGGPAMIEGGGLGVFRPEEVGPTAVQYPNGVIDVLVETEDEAVDAAKKYLSYFQGRVSGWEAPDPRRLRHVIPENRLEVYDVHAAIEGIADIGSVMELRAGFAPGMVTALIRVEGRPVGVIANNPIHLAGAIDSPAADKAARFLQLCDAFDIPVLSLCDTPGMMVGPEVEKTALVRHCSRLFVIGANLSIPLMTIVLRKAYGLGAQAMAAGSFRAPLFVAAWPTGEFGGMGLEGAVKLGYRKELEAETDLDKRRALFDRLVAQAYAHGKATYAASVLEFDNVIDPADSRAWIAATLEATPAPPPRTGKKRPFIDTW
ncbi:MAG: carboxyl transferase domain-containing protein [Pikeienuella sp.]